jgi:hypothetical protein
MKKKLAGIWKEKKRGYWPVQINGNKFATGQILEKPVSKKLGRGQRIFPSWLISKVSRNPVMVSPWSTWQLIPNTLS